MRLQGLLAVVALLILTATVVVLMREPPVAPLEEPTRETPATPSVPSELESPSGATRVSTTPAGQARIDVRVIEDSGERVVGCDVELRAAGEDEADSPALARGTSAGGGAIRFDGLALGPYVLRVADPDYVGIDVAITLTAAMGFGQAVVVVRPRP